jgi:hypothetical protein
LATSLFDNLRFGLNESVLFPSQSDQVDSIRMAIAYTEFGVSRFNMQGARADG